MISYIKTKNGHSESDNIFIFEYSLGNDNVEYRFDVDLHNYGNEIVAIKATKDDDDDELYTTDRLDVIEEQLDFVVESTRLEHMLKLIYLDNKPSNKDIDISKELISEFCTKWDLIHETSV